MRHPYGQLYTDALYESMAGDGYAVLFQNDRGRFGSEGQWWPLHEISVHDGADTVDWIAAQPWCDGNVGLFGSSYAGVTQWHTATAAPDALRAMAPVVAGSIQDYFPFVAPGVWALGTLMGWTLNVASHEAEKLGLESDNRDIRHFMDLNRKLMEATRSKHRPKNRRTGSNTTRKTRFPPSAAAACCRLRRVSSSIRNWSSGGTSWCIRHPR